MRFKIAAKKFLEGKFPAFPPATYLAALQAQIDADAANYDAEMKKWTVRRRPSLSAFLFAPLKSVLGASLARCGVCGGSMNAPASR